MKKWAVVANRQPLQSIEEADPVPTGSEVLIKVSHCGVCHSDLYFWEGEYNFGRKGMLRLSERGVTLPRAPGHEVVGTVVAFGPDVTGLTKGGKHIVYPWIGCGECERCKAGEDNLCSKQASLGVVRDGGFSSHVLVPHPRYLVELGDLDPAVASTYACSGITALSAIRKLDIKSPDRAVLLIGAGGLGHSAIAMLKAIGHKKIVVVELNEAKRRAALDAGATDVIDATAPDVVEQVSQKVGQPLLHALDFVNNSETTRLAFDCLGAGGKLILVGVAGGELEINLAGMVFVPKTVSGSKTGTIQDLREVVALAQEGKLKPIPVNCLPADQATEALTALKAGKVTGRLVLVHPPT